jgi:hypothetical protein
VIVVAYAARAPELGVTNRAFSMLWSAARPSTSSVVVPFFVPSGCTSNAETPGMPAALAALAKAVAGAIANEPVGV